MKAASPMDAASTVEAAAAAAERATAAEAAVTYGAAASTEATAAVEVVSAPVAGMAPAPTVPRADADEDAVIEPLGTVVAIRRAGIWVIRVVAIGAVWRAIVVCPV